MADSSLTTTGRITVRGKFLFKGEHKYWVKGVTYGTFAPDVAGDPFPVRARVEADFAAMAANGFNTVRTYTAPPHWLLDVAAANGLRVMAGLAWEQHTAFLDSAAQALAIQQRVREQVRRCAGHPALLCFTVGNEIPAAIVRWHGRRRIERFIRRLYRICKQEDPGALVTYVNFPTTEYLRLDFLDLACFNVYLESEAVLDAYLARLQNEVGERPLLMAEIGLDSQRNGEDKQAECLAWQIRTSFAAGCVGALVFAWTDEWHRGGHEILDWDFGISDRSRKPKPALAAVRQAFADAPFPANMAWPSFTVVVCSFNGAATIRDTMEGLAALEYPNYRVIVVNDGSTDATPQIVSEYDCRLLSTENRGLSNARNTGWQEANTELVAYIDDDAYPDPHWLHFLAHVFMTTDHAGAGGPNVAPPGDGPIADCTANAPGRPVHVLLEDRLAEHVPGCNMAFRREALAAIGGFDPVYRAAGDDVDVCWRLQQAGGTIGFHAAALDWHHCRNSLKTYWKQQQGYGKAEALLEAKWPEKYNAAGHFSWRGRLYGKGITPALVFSPARIYQGTWGMALFQSIYQPAAGFWTSLSLMPEWYLVVALLALLSLLGISWPPLLYALPLLTVAIVLPVLQAVLAGARARFSSRWTAPQRLGLHVITALMHLGQPAARLIGRLRNGLTLWRQRLPDVPSGVRANRLHLWSEHWHPTEEWLGRVARNLRATQVPYLAGGDYDAWDLEIRGGMFGAARLHIAIEEHGAGKQFLRIRTSRAGSVAAPLIAALLGLLGLGAFGDGASLTGGALIAGGTALVLRVLMEARHAQAVLLAAARGIAEHDSG